MTDYELGVVTEWIKERIWINPDVMFARFDMGEYLAPTEYFDDVSDLVDVISSLHNLLYEAVTGERYNYAFHWCNKCGSDTTDDIFDSEMKKISDRKGENENAH